MWCIAAAMLSVRWAVQQLRQLVLWCPCTGHVFTHAEACLVCSAGHRYHGHHLRVNKGQPVEANMMGFEGIPMQLMRTLDKALNTDVQNSHDLGTIR